MHPEERASIDWLQQHTGDNKAIEAQSGLKTDPATFAKIQSLVTGNVVTEIFPTLVGADSYVVLGYTTVHKGEATAVYRGDSLTYRYPFGVLDSTKNKIYSSDGAAIYR